MRVTQASGLEGIDQGIYNLDVRFSERIACKCKCELFDDHGCMYTKACKGELTPSPCYEWWTICACSSPTGSFMPFCNVLHRPCILPRKSRLSRLDLMKQICNEVCLTGGMAHIAFAQIGRFQFQPPTEGRYC